jgi:hypothetical protein
MTPDQDGNYQLDFAPAGSIYQTEKSVSESRDCSLTFSQKRRNFYIREIVKYFSISAKEI